MTLAVLNTKPYEAAVALAAESYSCSSSSCGRSSVGGRGRAAGGSGTHPAVPYQQRQLAVAEAAVRQQEQKQTQSNNDNTKGLRPRRALEKKLASGVLRSRPRWMRTAQPFDAKDRRSPEAFQTKIPTPEHPKTGAI